MFSPNANYMAMKIPSIISAPEVTTMKDQSYGDDSMVVNTVLWMLVSPYITEGNHLNDVFAKIVVTIILIGCIHETKMQGDQHGNRRPLRIIGHFSPDNFVSYNIC